jgi:hypothetical protein
MESGIYRSRFGSSVSVSADGRIFAVGAKDALNAGGVATGAVYLYSMDSVYDDGGDGGVGGNLTGTIGTRGLATPTKATLLQELFGSEAADDEFGATIALSRDGSRLVVGSRSENNEQNGAIRIYQRGGEDEDADGVEDVSTTTDASATLEDGGGVENATITTDAFDTGEDGDEVTNSTNMVTKSTNATDASGTRSSRRWMQAGSTNTWTLMAKGLIHGPDPSGRAGWAVSISSDGNGELCIECSCVLF